MDAVIGRDNQEDTCQVTGVDFYDTLTTFVSYKEDQLNE